jgi:hypothetical protein
MKGFIKITDVNQYENYLNINHIVKFNPLNGDYDGNTIIYLAGGQNVVTIQTSTTPEEVIDMIDLASL